MRNLDCETAQAWIVEDLDQSLDEDRRRRLEQHAAGCEACREAELAFTDLWVSLVRDVPDDPGEGYWKEYRASLNAKLDEVSIPRTRFWSSWSLGWKATAVFAPAMVAIVLMFLVPAKESTVQLGANTARNQMLLQELNEVYGPTAEEIIPIAYVERVRSNLSCSNQSATGVSVMRWFEVEDEPSFPYL